MSVKLLNQLSEYKERIDEQINRLNLEGPPQLTQACLYALQNGGKRFRPAIVYMVAEALGSRKVDDAALAVELFHTASLIADDLPCMDNDLERRGKPTLHRAFDEKTALLATYALIAEGYDRLRKNAPASLLPLIIEQTSKNTGLLGATSGQLLDLSDHPSEELITVLYLKTGALFELSFTLGWILGGGKLPSLEMVRQAAHHFGIAFQIADDIDDFEQDEKRIYNFARHFGLCKAKKRVEEELKKARDLLEELKISGLYELAELIGGN